MDENKENKNEEVLGPNQSPVQDTPKVFVEAEEKQIDFYEAIKAIVEGKKVTKLEWGNREIYGVLDNAVLKLHKVDGKLYSWLLNDGDINGTDYVVIS